MSGGGKGEDFFDEALETMDSAVENKEQEDAANDWDPSEGDLLKGVFLKATVVPTKYGPAILALVKDLDDSEGGSLKVWCTRSVLKSEILDAMPAKGSLVAIRYSGMRESNSGNEYHVYQVRAQKSDIDYWTALSAEMHKPVVQKSKTPADFTPPDEAPF